MPGSPSLRFLWKRDRSDRLRYTLDHGLEPAKLLVNRKSKVVLHIDENAVSRDLPNGVAFLTYPNPVQERIN
jgi:hypothetical protein